jgi:hypothetical protein
MLGRGQPAAVGSWFGRQRTGPLMFGMAHSPMDVGGTIGGELHEIRSRTSAPQHSPSGTSIF